MAYKHSLKHTSIFYVIDKHLMTTGLNKATYNIFFFFIALTLYLIFQFIITNINKQNELNRVLANRKQLKRFHFYSLTISF